MTIHLTCRFCTEPAHKLAAQSTDAGRTLDWVPACKFHLDGWWEDADYGPVEFRPLGVPTSCEQCKINTPTKFLTPSFAPRFGWYGCDECAAKTERCAVRALSAEEAAGLQLLRTVVA